jgi:ATP-dependent Clp protease ATP-binding subunit ClpA
MSDNEYKVKKIWIAEAEFEILVIEIPDNELEDKLAYLARDKGNITRNYYEDFVIATCVANINQFLFHIKGQTSNPEALLKVRQEVMEAVIKVNPGLTPENIVINRNSVLKLKGDKKLEEDERLLKDNKSWDVPYLNDPNLEELEEGPQQPKSPKRKETKKKEKKDISDLDYTIVKKWWKRINKYIEVKEFKEDDVESLFNERFFHSRANFQTYIVTLCVVDSEDLFVLLDNLGVPSRVAPPILIKEVYNICLEINPFLTFENAQEFFDMDDNEPEQQGNSRRQAPNRMASHAKQSSKKKKKKIRFRDLKKNDLLNLPNAMKVHVIGQDSAITQITEAIQRASVGLKDPERPIGSFLFAGKTGCGKTITSKVLADELIKDRDNLITIDCSEYSADHEYAKLIGSPHGYVGHEQGGVLTNALMNNPFSVLVFDEVEKASSKVHELMLQILEEGRLTDGKGNKVSFKDAVIIMTSNIGVGEVEDIKKTIGFGDVAKITEDKKNKAIDRAIKGKFKPEFLNRIDSIVYFNDLKEDDYMRIIDIELYKLNENLKNNNTDYKTLKLEFNRRVKKIIYKDGVNPEYGARPLKRCIEKEISTPLANMLLRSEPKENSVIKVGTKNNKIVFNVIEPEEDELKEQSAIANGAY